MRTHRLTLLLTLLIIALSGCKSTTSGDDDRPPVQFRGFLDGKPWQGTAVAGIYRDTLRISLEEPRPGMQTQGLYLEVPATGPGRFPVVGSSAYMEVVGGDQISYRAAVTEGSVTLQQFSPSGGPARGTVSVTVQGPRGTWAFVGQFETDVQPNE